MLSPQERYNIQTHMQRVQHDSIWGWAIHNFLAVFPAKTDMEIFQIMRDLQSQIDDNPMIMKNILGSEFDFFDTWMREPKSLNLNEHIQYLMKAAICRAHNRKAAANLLGISIGKFYTYKKQFNL